MTAFNTGLIARLTLPVNSFTDEDAVVRQAPIAQLAYGALGSAPTIVSASAGLPVSFSVGASSIGKAEDVSSANADVGVPSLAVRKATPANTSDTDGDYEFLQMSAGRLWTSAIVSQLSGSDIAHDGVDSGNPHKIGAKATSSVLGATPVAAADRTDLVAGTDGVLISRPYSSLEDIISEVKTNTDGASTAMTGAFAATASQRIYLSTLAIANSSATAITVDVRDGSAGSVLFTVPVPAGAGVIVSFPVPLRFSANTAAAFDGSAAATTLTVSMVGFKSKT